MDIFVLGVGVGLTHNEKLLIKKLRIARETGDLEAELDEDPKKPAIGRVAESSFSLPNEYSSSITLTDSDLILTNGTCAIAITADMSFKTALATDFKREYKNIEFLWKQRPGSSSIIVREAERSSLFRSIYDRTKFSASIEHFCQDAKRRR